MATFNEQEGAKTLTSAFTVLSENRVLIKMTEANALEFDSILQQTQQYNQRNGYKPPYQVADKTRKGSNSGSRVFEITGDIITACTHFQRSGILSEVLLNRALPNAQASKLNFNFN